MREMEDSLTKDPAGIYNGLDSALASAPDSMSYYRNMLLKAKALFYRHSCKYPWLIFVV